MNVALTILGLLACVGVVQLISWLISLGRRPGGMKKGYHLIPLYDHPDQLEAQVKYTLSKIQWGSAPSEIVLLVDMGLGEESRRICEALTAGMLGVFLCTKAELGRTVEQLDRIQME